MAETARTLLAKQRYNEWLSTRGELSALQIRIAIRLVSAWNPRHGFAWPSLRGIADDLGLRNHRSVVRAIDHLVNKGYFRRQRGRGGRGHATRYVPRFDRVPDGDVYAAARAETGTATPPFEAEDGADETGTARAETGTAHPRNGDRHAPRTEVRNRGRQNRPASAAPACADVRARQGELDDRQIATMLGLYEQTVRQRRLSPAEETQWDEFLERVAEERGGSRGDPLGGWAYRLVTQGVAGDVRDDGIEERGR